MFETAETGTIRKTYLQLRRHEDEIANEAINKTVEFFHKMGMDTKLWIHKKDNDATDFIVNRFDERDGKPLVGR
jgi:NADP-dependent alcohol dehydrogenase